MVAPVRETRDIPMCRLVLAIFFVFLACEVALSAAQAPRTREVVTYDDVAIDLIAEGSGPLVVMLPSRGRDSEDFDEVAAGIAGAGFRVLRPQPRGAGRSTGPLE